jgi:hypothetical protein
MIEVGTTNKTHLMITAKPSLKNAPHYARSSFELSVVGSGSVRLNSTNSRHLRERHDPSYEDRFWTIE